MDRLRLVFCVGVDPLIDDSFRSPQRVAAPTVGINACKVNVATFVDMAGATALHIGLEIDYEHRIIIIQETQLLNPSPNKSISSHGQEAYSGHRRI